MSNSELQMEDGAVNGVAQRLDAAEVDTLLATVATLALKMRACVPCRRPPPFRVLGSFPAEHEAAAGEIFAVLEKYVPDVKVTQRVHRPAIDGNVSFRCEWVGKKETGK